MRSLDSNMTQQCSTVKQCPYRLLFDDTHTGSSFGTQFGTDKFTRFAIYTVDANTD